MADPRDVATAYMEQHKIPQLFEVVLIFFNEISFVQELATLVYHEQPAKPQEFLIEKLEAMKRAKENGNPVRC